MHISKYPTHFGVIALSVVFAIVLLPASAFAASGAFSNAYANAEWTKANFGVSLEASPCLGGYCKWHPVVLAQPNLPAYSCAEGETFDSDRNTEVAWFGPEHTTNGSETTTLSEVPILHGVQGQRLCLEIVGENEHTSPVCEAQRPVFEEFFGPEICPKEKFIFTERAGSTLLTVAPVVQPIAPAPTVTTTTPVVTAPPKPLVCPKTKRKVTRHGKQVCVKPPKHHKHSKNHK